jgi:hypothetical protein
VCGKISIVPSFFFKKLLCSMMYRYDVFLYVRPFFVTVMKWLISLK